MESRIFIHKIKQFFRCTSFTLTMQDEPYKVSSELYGEKDYVTDSRPHLNKNNVVSMFQFEIPPKCAKQDKDGDLIVTRKAQNEIAKIEIEHSQSTGLDLVGLQVWRGALILADWLVYNGETISPDTIVLELGSGVGLTSIVAAMYAPVYCTDVDKGNILGLIDANVRRNKNLCKYPITVMELNFLNSKLPASITENLSKISLILAADVIYDDNITQEFVKTLEYLLCQEKSVKRAVYVALEKRYVFTIADCDSVAPCYEFFLRCLALSKYVKHELVSVDFPQYFQYKRVQELVLMKITLKY